MNLDGNAFRRAYARDGAAADERPEKVDNAMNPRQMVGFEQEEPLLDKDYDDYYRNDSLLFPRASDDLAALAEHELIADVEDMASELGSRDDKVEKALEIHDIEEPNGRDVTDTDRLHELVPDVPERLVTTQSPILVMHLYVMGLSVGEISDVLSETMPDHKSISPSTVTQCLIDAHVLPGETSTSAKRRRKNARGEINRASNGGISIHPEDL